MLQGGCPRTTRYKRLRPYLYKFGYEFYAPEASNVSEKLTSVDAAPDPFNQSLSGNATKIVNRPNTIGLLGVDLKLDAIYRLSLTMAILSSVGLAGILFMMWKANQKGESFLIHARFSDVLIRVNTDMPAEMSRLRVHSINDLVRMAKQQNRMVMWYSDTNGAHRYFLGADGYLYYYEVTDNTSSAMPGVPPV